MMHHARPSGVSRAADPGDRDQRIASLYRGRADVVLVDGAWGESTDHAERFALYMAERHGIKVRPGGSVARYGAGWTAGSIDAAHATWLNGGS